MSNTGSSAIDGTFGTVTLTVASAGNGPTLLAQSAVFAGTGSLGLSAGTTLSFNDSGTNTSTAASPSTGSFALFPNRSLSLTGNGVTTVSGILSTTSNAGAVNLQTSNGLFPLQILERVSSQPTTSALSGTFNVVEDFLSSTGAGEGSGTIVLQNGVPTGGTLNVITGATGTTTWTGGSLIVNTDGSVSGTIIQGFSSPVTWTTFGFLGQDGSLTAALQDNSGQLIALLLAFPQPSGGTSDTDLSGTLIDELPVTSNSEQSFGLVDFNGTGTITGGTELAANQTTQSITGGSYTIGSTGLLTNLSVSVSGGVTITGTGAFDRDKTFLTSVTVNQAGTANPVLFFK